MCTARAQRPAAQTGGSVATSPHEDDANRRRAGQHAQSARAAASGDSALPPSHSPWTTAMRCGASWVRHLVDQSSSDQNPTNIQGDILDNWVVLGRRARHLRSPLSLTRPRCSWQRKARGKDAAICHLEEGDRPPSSSKTSQWWVCALARHLHASTAILSHDSVFGGAYNADQTPMRAAALVVDSGPNLFAAGASCHSLLACTSRHAFTHVCLTNDCRSAAGVRADPVCRRVSLCWI